MQHSYDRTERKDHVFKHGLSHSHQSMGFIYRLCHGLLGSRKKDPHFLGERAGLAHFKKGVPNLFSGKIWTKAPRIPPSACLAQNQRRKKLWRVTKPILRTNKSFQCSKYLSSEAFLARLMKIKREEPWREKPHEWEKKFTWCLRTKIEPAGKKIVKMNGDEDGEI